MIPSWYNSPERLALLEAAVKTWVGTPFRLNSHVAGPGGGIDCAYLLNELHFATGFLPRLAIPFINPGSFMHDDVHDFVSVFDQAVGDHFSAVPEASSLAPGDGVFIRYRSTVQHLVTILPRGLCIHSMVRVGVTVTPLAALLAQLKYSPMIAAIRRPKP